MREKKRGKEEVEICASEKVVGDFSNPDVSSRSKKNGSSKNPSESGRNCNPVRLTRG